MLNPHPPWTPENWSGDVSGLPAVSRKELSPSEDRAIDFQRRLEWHGFTRVKLLKDTDNFPEGWSLHDNATSISCGWIITSAHEGDVPELYCLKQGWCPYTVFEILIKPYINEGGLEAKAYATLVGLKLRYPDHRFLYDKSAEDIYGKRDNGRSK